jgi:ribosomal protein S18 acetylase RimI-like enzyme
MKIDLILAAEKDWREVAEFEKEAECRIFHAYTTEEDVTKMIRSDHVFFAVLDSEKIGVIAYHENPDSNHITDFIVAKKLQGKGLGLQILKNLIEKLGEDKQFDLVTHPENSAAIITYLKAGFLIKDLKENFFGDGEPRIVLEKEKND